MKILYLCNEFPVLSETFLIYEINDLLKQGADVRIFTLTHPKPGQKSDLPKELGFENRIYHRVPLKEKPLGRNIRKFQLMTKEVLRGNKAGVKMLSNDRQTSAEYSRYMLMETANSMRMSDGWKPDIIHCHFGTVGRFAAIMKHYGLLKAKISTIFHGYDISRYPKKHGEDCYKTLWHQGDLFLSVNNYYLLKIQELGAVKEKCDLFHMGVDLNDFTFDPRSLPPEEETLKVISVGRMTEKKGFEYTIRAFAEVLKQLPDRKVHLDLIGDGPLRQSLESLTEELGIKSNVTFHGVLQHTEVKAHLKKAHIFILPSVTAADGDMEGIPVVLMESMAQGLPTISTRHSGIPDLIHNKENGFLAEEKNPDELANYMISLANNSDLWPDITKSARTMVENEFNRSKQAEKLYKHFETLINS